MHVTGYIGDTKPIKQREQKFLEKRKGTKATPSF